MRHEIEIWSRPDAESPWLRRVATGGQRVELEGNVVVDVDDLFREPLPPR